MGELVSRGSKYSDADRRMAVHEYHLCGCLATVSESIGIPRKTLGDWFRSGWWNQLTAEVRQEESEPVLNGEVAEVAETKIGRPTAYKKEYAEQAMRLCLLGATDQEMAGFFSVSEQTINTWKGKHPSFLESIRKGKIETLDDLDNATRGSSAITNSFRVKLGFYHPPDWADRLASMNEPVRPGWLYRFGVMKANNPEMMYGELTLLRYGKGGPDGESVLNAFGSGGGEKDGGGKPGEARGGRINVKVSTGDKDEESHQERVKRLLEERRRR